MRKTPAVNNPADTPPQFLVDFTTRVTENLGLLWATTPPAEWTAKEQAAFNDAARDTPVAAAYWLQYHAWKD